MSAFLEKIRPKHPLYLQLMFTALAFLVMIFLSDLFMRNIVQGHLVQNTQNVLESVQDEINSNLRHFRLNLGSFSRAVRTILLSGEDPGRLRVFFHDISEYVLFAEPLISSFSSFFGYFETFPDGHVFIESLQWEKPDSYFPTERPWYRNAVAANGDIAETLMYLDTVTGEPTLVYSICIFDDQGRRLGVVGQRIRIDAIGQDLVETALAKGGYGMLLSKDLIMLAHPHLDFVGKNLQDLASSAISALANDLLNRKEVSDVPVITFKNEDAIAFLRILTNGWYLGLVTPKAPYYQIITSMTATISALGLAMASILMYILVRIDVARNKADEESKQKSAFLAKMSHEMRTPLNAVIGLSELILGDEELSGENYLKLESIYNSGMTLLSTVNDILDISKIESGKFELIPVDYDVPSLINDAVTQSIMRIANKSITFVLDINEDLPTRLYGDDLRIKQMLNNLLSNAFKYTLEGTVKLTIRCKRVSGTDTVWLTAQVSDTGMGIRKEDMSHMFTNYIQVDKKSHRKIEGTGLGLPITRNIAEMMGGLVSVESVYGKGSVFTIKIQQRFVTNEVIGAKVVDSLKGIRYSNQKRHRNARMTRVSMPYARVLVVDDVVTNLDVAKGMMKPYAMQIDCVESGQEAIDAIRAEKVRYNAVFMDHMMPAMDGVEATRIIREEIGTEYAKTVPIIALTANAILGNEEMFLSNGFQAFIPKPIEIGKLDSVLRQWVRDKTREDELTAENDNSSDETTAPRVFPFRIEGVDLQKGLERFGGDGESFLRVLHSYAINTPPLLESIKKVNAENLTDYIITVHGIKSSSFGICADMVGKTAEALEKAGKEGNLDFIHVNNTSLIQITERLINALDDMFTELAAENSKPKKDKPDNAVLAKLLAACKAYNMDGVDAAMTEIESCEYHSGDELVAWLRDNIDRMNFAQIIEKLSVLTGITEGENG